MNYIEIINRFWQMRRACRLSSTEADLLYFLVQESNIREWANPFSCSNKLICATLGMQERTLIETRKRLQKKGFIDFENGCRNLYSPKYKILIDTTSRVKSNKTNNKAVDKKAASKTVFIKPTVAEIEAYCIERKNSVSAQRFFDFYQSKNWMVGRNAMKDWQAAVRNWENNATNTKMTVKHNSATTGNKLKYEQF